MSRRTRHETVYVVLRVDAGLPAVDPEGSELGPCVRCGRFQVTVKEVLTSHEEAVGEVDRLNALNRSATCKYFWTGSRYFPDGGSFGGGPDEEGD